MIEFEWEKQGKRAEAAAILRELAKSLDGDGPIELEHDGWELKLEAGESVQLGIEVEASGDEVELEIELKWSRAAPPKAAGKG